MGCPACSILLAPCPPTAWLQTAGGQEYHKWLQLLAKRKRIFASACLASHMCSLKVYFPSFHSPRKFASTLLGFFFFFFLLHLFGCNSCPPAISLLCFSSRQLLPLLIPIWTMGNQNSHWTVMGPWKLQSLHSRGKGD